MTTPFSVRVVGDPEGRLSLVLAASYPYLLVGPADESLAPRWVRADAVEFGRVYFDQPWHASFSTPAPEHDHGGGA
jgi:hypothetical protein